MSSVVQIPHDWKLVLSPIKHPAWCVDSQHLVYMLLLLYTFLLLEKFHVLSSFI